MKITLYFFLLLLAGGCHGKLITELQEKKYIVLHETKPTVLMIESNQCGFSNLARKSILPLFEQDSIPLIFLTYPLDIVSFDDGFKQIGSSQLKNFNYKFFPQFLVIKPNGKYTHIRGWDRKRKDKLFKALL
jgi:hypothetical protein